MPNVDQSIRRVVLGFVDMWAFAIGIDAWGSRIVPCHPPANARSAPPQATWPPHAVRAGTLGVLFALRALPVPKRSYPHSAIACPVGLGITSSSHVYQYSAEYFWKFREARKTYEMDANFGY